MFEGSKKTGGSSNVIASGYVATGKSAAVQVIYNGKIATPQSLLPRKAVAGPSNAAGKFKAKVEAVALNNPTIDELGADIQDKPLQPHSSTKAMKRSLFKFIF